MTIGVGHFAVSDRMREYVSDVLDRARLSYGRYSKAFEQQFAKLHECEYGVLSNSGTSSLQTALQALKSIHNWPDGSEVLVPSVTFVASINIVLHNNLIPVLVDVEDDFYCMDPERAMRAVTDRTVAILPVHLFGQPCNMPAIAEIAYYHDLRIVEDGCEAAFASIDDKSISSWGDIGCHSLYAAHIITAGVGGIALTSNRDYAIKMRSLVNHGLSYEHLSATDEFDPAMLSRNFVFDSIGHSYRITELEAAIALAQLENWKAIAKARQYNYAYFIEGLIDLENRELIQLPMVRNNVQFTPMMFPVMVLRESKHGLMQYLTEHGIGVRDTVPLVNQPCYAGLWEPANYPVAQWMDEHGLYWGVHQGLTQRDMDTIIDVVHGYFKR